VQRIARARAWKTIKQYEYMYEEHSDECMDDAIKQHEYRYEEHSDEYMDDTRVQIRGT
jgi:hypothetical protein